MFYSQCHIGPPLYWKTYTVNKKNCLLYTSTPKITRKGKERDVCSRVLVCAPVFFPLRTRVKAALETKGRDERSVKIASFEQKKRKAENKNIFLNRCKCRTRNDDNDDGSDDDDDDGNGVRWRRQRRRRT